MKILVTGTPGFIGSHFAIKLLERHNEVVGFDGLSGYCDFKLEKAGLARFMDHPNYTDTEADVSDLIERVGYRPTVSVGEGVTNFVRYYTS